MSEAGRETSSRPSAAAPIELEEIDVEATAEPPLRFHLESEGATLYSGKKTTITELDALPAITNNNLRQTFALTPGLVISEVTNGSIASLTYRGLGEANESLNILTLKDGIPVSPDMYGYPGAYYTPPMEQIERVDFIRGGASLLFGPQPGGAINYIQAEPRLDRPLGGILKLVYGSNNLFTGYGRIDGTIDHLGGEGVGSHSVGYMVDFNRYQGHGIRAQNSDFWSMNGSATIVIDADKPTRYRLHWDSYASDFGEPGGLTLGRYQEDRTQASSLFNRLRIQRHIGSFDVTHTISDRTVVEVKAFGGYYDRTNQTQLGSVFGELTPQDNVDFLQKQHYAIGSAIARLKHDYDLFGERSSISGGMQLYGTWAPVYVDKGVSASDPVGRAGAMTRADRHTLAAAFFAENTFRFRGLRVTPGVRFELLHQFAKTTLNLDTGSFTGGPPGAPLVGPDGSLALSDKERPAFAPLPGLGVSYQVNAGLEPYFNVTTGYKPMAFNDGVTLQSVSNIIVANTFQPTYSVTMDLGARGQPKAFLTYDASVFLVDFENQVGTLACTPQVCPSAAMPTPSAFRQNVGHLRNWGAEAALELDVLGLAFSVAANRKSPWGQLSLFGNAQFLDARFISGPAAGNRPEYAPPYLVRTGFIYRFERWLKVSLLGSFVGAQNGVDNNNPYYAIPAYTVWDVTAEGYVWKERIGLVAGLNNIFNARYYSRVLAGEGGGGIDPAAGRTFYVGVTSKLP